MAGPYEQETASQDTAAVVPPVTAADVHEPADDPAPTGPSWPEATDPVVEQSRAELFSNYGESCDQDGGGGAGGAPGGGDGAEGSGPGCGTDSDAPAEKGLWQRVKDWWSGDSDKTEQPASGTDAPQTDEPEKQTEEPKSETPAEQPAEPAVKKKPSEMTPEERAADKSAKMDEYAKQSPEEKQARWAKSDGKLDKDTWDEIQKLKDPTGKPDLAAQKQAMLQAGIDKLDYDDPRRAQLEKIQSTMNGKDSRTGGAYETGTAQTGCGGTVDEMLRKGGDPSQGKFPGYVNAEKREALPTGEGQEQLKNAQTEAEKQVAKDKINAVTPKSGDVYELQNPTNDPNGHGHAGTFVVASPDGKTWLTYDGGQQARTASKEEIKLVMRNVSVDAQGRTKVGAPDSPSGTAADNQGRAVSGTYDYQKMYDKYPALHPPAAR